MEFKFSAVDMCNGVVEHEITMSGDADSWADQASMFIRFLHAQGFALSERHLADYYEQLAEEWGDIRSNTIGWNDEAGTD